MRADGRCDTTTQLEESSQPLALDDAASAQQDELQHLQGDTKLRHISKVSPLTPPYINNSWV